MARIRNPLYSLDWTRLQMFVPGLFIILCIMGDSIMLRITSGSGMEPPSPPKPPRPVGRVGLLAGLLCGVPLVGCKVDEVELWLLALVACSWGWLEPLFTTWMTCPLPMSIESVVSYHAKWCALYMMLEWSLLYEETSSGSFKMRPEYTSRRSAAIVPGIDLVSSSLSS